jgi:hypothetical protein
MGWIEVKSVWLDCPYFADVFEGREAHESLQPPPIILAVDEVAEMRRQLRVTVVMVAFDGGLLDRPVHPFDLPVGPGMLDFGEPVLDSVFVAPHVEHVDHPSGCGAAWIRATRKAEADTQYGC